MDILLLGIPRLVIDGPPLGIAQIKSSVNAAGFQAKCYDLNIDLYNNVTFDEWLELDNYFQTDLRYTGNDISHRERQIDFFQMHAKKVRELRCFEKYQTFLDNWVTTILADKAAWVGISVFSVNSVLFTIDLTQKIKQRAPDQKILLGGMGVSSFGIGARSNFGEFMISQGLAERYVSGEGEYSTIDILKGADNINAAPQIGDLDKLPFADYDDFNFASYPNFENYVYMTGSRGCIRSCTFCDIQSLWKKYRYRSAQNIVDEMVVTHKKYGTTEFYFTDSLINGHLNNFMKTCQLIIDAKMKGLLPENLMFGGQWICRPAGKHTEEYYRLASEAGAYNLSIGIESGSDQVLKHMGKGVTRLDYDYETEYLSKYGIRSNFLILIGYVTETERDFQDTLDMFTDYKKYGEEGIIWGVNLGKTLVILPGSPLGKNSSQYDLEFDANGNWYSKNNLLDYPTRIRRRIHAQKHLESLGYVVASTVTNVNSLHEIVKNGGYDSVS